jgi:hypothetical protein
LLVQRQAVATPEMAANAAFRLNQTEDHPAFIGEQSNIHALPAERNFHAAAS